jgi:Hg(II)-responsive transcriptional regulator
MKTATIEPTQSLTIGALAKAACVGIETIRYYQTIDLLPTPRGDAGYRRYPIALVERIRFIKRAQELGWSLSEIASLLKLEDGTHRREIQSIAKKRLVQIEAQLADLRRVKRILMGALDACVHGDGAAPCPIIRCLSSPTSQMHR